MSNLTTLFTFIVCSPSWELPNLVKVYPSPLGLAWYTQWSWHTQTPKVYFMDPSHSPQPQETKPVLLICKIYLGYKYSQFLSKLIWSFFWFLLTVKICIYIYHYPHLLFSFLLAICRLLPPAAAVKLSSRPRDHKSLGQWRLLAFHRNLPLLTNK